MYRYNVYISKSFGFKVQIHVIFNSVSNGEVIKQDSPLLKY